MQSIDLTEKFERIDQTWTPKIIAALNGQHVKLARIEGEFVWHVHEDADELFLVVEGRMEMHLRDAVHGVESGQIFVVPRGVEHKPVAPDGACILMVEPAGTLNTGSDRNERTVEAPEWI